MASSQGDLDLVCLLLEREAEVDAEDVDGKKSYQIALGRGHDEVIQLLLSHGAESRT